MGEKTEEFNIHIRIYNKWCPHTPIPDRVKVPYRLRWFFSQPTATLRQVTTELPGEGDRHLLHRSPFGIIHENKPSSHSPPFCSPSFQPDTCTQGVLAQRTKPFCPGYRDKSVCFCTGKQRKEPIQVKKESWKGPGWIYQPNQQIPWANSLNILATNTRGTSCNNRRFAPKICHRYQKWRRERDKFSAIHRGSGIKSLAFNYLTFI